MFSSIQSSDLGKSNTGCIKGNSYKSSDSNSMNVSLVPIKNISGNMNFVPLIENKNETLKITIPSDIYNENNIDSDSDSNSDSDKDSTNINAIGIFNLDNDYIKTFYIGSITVVGLYVLFRILDKRK